MNKYKGVPIAAAKRLAQTYDKDQVIIICWDKAHAKQHVTTYGKSKQNCIEAAKFGNFIKKDILGWPDELRHTKPKRNRTKRGK